MRKHRQILWSVLLAVILLGVAYWAGQDQPQPRQIQVVTLTRDVPAGSQLESTDLEAILVADHPSWTSYFADPVSATGLWTKTDLQAGEFLSKQQAGDPVTGLNYPNPGPGRRLMTVELKIGDANGLYLAAGNRIDLHLVPRQRDGIAPQTLHDVPVVAVLGNHGQPLKLPLTGNLATALLCLDVDRSQADILASAQSQAFIRVSVVNELA